MKKIIYAVLACCLIPYAAYAASFDCRKTGNPAEKLICEDKTLSSLDVEMATVYRMLRSDLNAKKAAALVGTQKLWIAKRNACRDHACLKFSYEQRIAELRELQFMGANAVILESADEESNEPDPSRALMLKCSYSDYKTFQYEFVEVLVASDQVGDAPAIKVFARQEKSDSQQFLVPSGSVAECVYPSGTRVRVKVGEGEARPYGECGADPEVFATVWVNGRKVSSRQQFAGRCMEYREGYQQPSFKIMGGTKTSVQKCATRKSAQGLVQEKDAMQPKREPLVVCVDYPDISSYPIDRPEYPLPGTNPLSVGAIELQTGRDEVCKVVQRELEADFYTFSNYSQKVTLARPAWEDTDVELPTALRGGRVSVFDFDNDGKLDRIFSRLYESNYMHGSVLLVQPGDSAKTLSVGASLLDQTSLYLPCQMDKKSRAIADCPGFSQNADEAGYEIPGSSRAESVYFRGRYTSISPFIFRNTTYLGLSSYSYDTSNYVAIVKPLPARKFQPICLFRQVPENF